MDNPPNRIECGSVTCDAVCCPSDQRCGQQDTDCLDLNGMGVFMNCDGPEDCLTGDTCCMGTGVGNSGGFACRASPCASSQRQACHESSECPNGLTCQTPAEVSLFVPTVKVCVDM